MGHAAITLATAIDASSAQCFSCGVVREMYQLERCQKCGVFVCGIAPCTSHCSCDFNSLERHDADSLLADKNFHDLFCVKSKDCTSCFLRSSNHISFAQDREGRFVYASPRTLRILGLLPRDILGRTVNEICDDPDAIYELNEMEKDARRTGQIQTRCVNWLRDDHGRYKTWLVHKASMANGLLLGVAVDISDHANRPIHASHDIRKMIDPIMKPTVQKSIMGALFGMPFINRLLHPHIMQFLIHHLH